MKRWIICFLVCSFILQGILAQTGNVGINTLTPQARVHAIRNGVSGGPLLSNALAIFEDDQSSFIHFSHFNNAESGLISGNQNTSIRSAMIFGTDSSVFFRAGGNFTRAYLTKNGNFGINIIAPTARLHAVRNGTSGGPLLSNALAIFEDNQSSFIHLSHLNTAESGILSGNQSTLVRSGLIFGSDSSVLFRAGGNVNRMAIKNSNVGINTISPAAMLHVKDGSTLFTGPVSFPGSADPPASGAGSRMMWYADKAALRAGRVTGEDWDKDSIGLYSFATGIDTRALGESSVAMGEQTVASGWFSTSLGFVSQATGLASTAVGLGTIATGGSSFAAGAYTNSIGGSSAAFGHTTSAEGFCSASFGQLTNALGENAATFGLVNQSFGEQAMTLGFLTTAKGDNSTAMGEGSFAKAYASLAIGRYNDTTAVSAISWEETDPVFVIGNGSLEDGRRNAMTVLKNGRTGINTNVPLAMLHVKDSSVVFTAPGGLPGSPGDPPVSGAGTRMMWYPEKAAFRAGRVIGTQWNRDSIGTHSIAFGLNTKAKGVGSMAIGYSTNAPGEYAMSTGHSTTASGFYSTAIGSSCIASGSTSFASGGDTKASGIYSATFGFASMAGATNAIATGNGTRASGFNAMSMGYFTSAPGDNATSMGSQSIARSFATLAIGRYNDTTSMTSLTNWVTTDPVFVIGNGSANDARSNALTVLKNGKTGINTVSPDAMLHVVKDVPTNGPYNANAAAIFEGDQGSFIQLSNDNAIQSGILSGNEATSLRSALIFPADSSVQIRAGGNSTRMTVTKAGNTGIGTLTPEAKLDVNGTAIIGTNGTALTEIIKVTVLSDVPNVPANSTVTETIPVTNSTTTSSVSISPASALANGLIIAYARVSVAGTVEVKFTNTTGADINPSPMNFYITVIR